ncbi:MAG: BrnA antitoxin family protein [Thermoanaerobaculia bacterium]
MRKTAAEPYRDIDFSRARRGPVVQPEPGKTKISIRLDNRVIDHFRAIVERAGGGNYQTLINDALVAHVEQRSVLDAVRTVVREELSAARRHRLTGTAATGAAARKRAGKR